MPSTEAELKVNRDTTFKDLKGVYYNTSQDNTREFYYTDTENGYIKIQAYIIDGVAHPYTAENRKKYLTKVTEITNKLSVPTYKTIIKGV